MNNSDKDSNKVAIPSDRVSLSKNVKQQPPSKNLKNGTEIDFDRIKTKIFITKE